MSDNKNSIKCPNCGCEFDSSSILRKQIEEEYAKNYAKKIKENEIKIKQETEKILDAERKRLSQKYQNEFSEATTVLQKSLEETNKQLAEARKEQVELIKLKQEFASQKTKQELEIEQAKKEAREIERKNFQYEINQKISIKEEEFKRMLAQNNYEKEILERKLKDTVEIEKLNLQRNLQKEFDEILRKKENENNLLLEQEKIKNEQISKKLEETQKTLNQGSMQRQGEAQERILIDKLKEKFPQDLYKESRPGQPESDITQTIRNETGIECGTILYESKNTKTYNKNWIDKLKKDGFNAKADVLVLVTKTMPDYNQELHFTDGVWICPFSAFEIVAMTLRSGLVMTFQAGISQQNRAEKMALLYDFMVGNEFRHYLSAIVEGITNVKRGYENEKNQLQKIWKQREKEFDTIILSATECYAAIRGIAGNSIAPIPVLELTDTVEENFGNNTQINLMEDSLNDY